MAADQSGKLEILTLPIARLVPRGEDAEKALDDLVNYKQLSKYHRSHIEAERTLREADNDEELTSQGTENESQVTSSRVAQDQDVEMWTGHYILSFDRPSFGTTALLRWRVGRGTSKLPHDRGVDIMVVCPGTRPKGVTTLHALIQFHPQSGVLMLSGLDDAHPVEYYLENNCLRLGSREKHVLYQQINRFKLGKLEFDLVYENLTDQQYSDYITVRNKIFTYAGYGTPHSRLLAVPKEPRLRIGTVIIHESLSTGTFGMVSAAVDSRTGDPLAIKESVIKNSRERGELQKELDIATSFQVIVERTRISDCRLLNI